MVLIMDIMVKMMRRSDTAAVDDGSGDSDGSEGDDGGR